MVVAGEHMFAAFASRTTRCMLTRDNVMIRQVRTAALVFSIDGEAASAMRWSLTWRLPMKSMVRVSFVIAMFRGRCRLRRGLVVRLLPCGASCPAGLHLGLRVARQLLDVAVYPVVLRLGHLLGCTLGGGVPSGSWNHQFGGTRL